MGKKKLLEKLRAFFDQDAQDREANLEDLKEVLKKLKKKEKQLKAECEAEADEERKQVICKEVSILHAQRKKGLRLLQEDKD
jgi:predicted metal-dependent enzyme (double-stranded beta helix superfamily)